MKIRNFTPNTVTVGQTSFPTDPAFKNVVPFWRPDVENVNYGGTDIPMFLLIDLDEPPLPPEESGVYLIVDHLRFLSESRYREDLLIPVNPVFDGKGVLKYYEGLGTV